MRTEKSSRWAAMLLAAVVAIVTSAVVANATQTITTPNAAFISYNLTTGTSSSVITPASNKSVLVMGCCTTAAHQGAGQVFLLVIPTLFIQWDGFESYGSFPTTLTYGKSIAPFHMVYIDASHEVDIQVASSTTILVHNASTGTRAGNVTLIW
jgi:hypothetical protein